MFKNKVSCFLVICLIAVFSSSVLSAGSKREELKKQFAPSRNIMQMQNVAPQNEMYYADEVRMQGEQDQTGRLSSSEREPFIGEYAIYQSEYETKIEEDIAFVKGSVELEVFRRTGAVKIPLAASSVGLKEVSLNRRPSVVIREGNKYVLVVTKPGSYKLDLEFFIQVKREREQGPGSFSFDVLPSPISILDVEMQEPEVEIFVEPSIKLEAERLPKKTLATVILPFTNRVTIRWSKALPKEVIPEVALEPKIYVETVTLASVGDGVAKCSSSLHYSILQSEVSNLRVSFPEDVGILEVNGNQLRDWKIKTEEGRQILDVYLNYGVKGNYILNLTYERNIGAGSVMAQVPDIHVVGTERERGFVGIEARTNIELAFNKLSGASVIDVKELPQQVWSKARNPLLLAFKYLKYPYSAIIDVTKHEEISVLVAAIDSASYVTLFTEEGKVLTKATYQMRNNVKQFVRLSLPKDASLWSCFVSGKPVKPARDKEGRVLIPLEKSQMLGEALTQFPVEVVYLTKNSKFKILGGIKLELPKLDIPESELLWSVYLPDRFNYFRFDGDVEMIKKERVRFARELAKRVPAAPQMEDEEAGYYKDKSIRHDRKLASRKELLSQQQVVMEEQVFDAAWTAQARGVLPIRIDIPTSGRLYRFSKLLVTDESPWISVIYLRSAGSFTPVRWAIWIVVAAFIIFLLRRVMGSRR